MDPSRVARLTWPALVLLAVASASAAPGDIEPAGPAPVTLYVHIDGRQTGMLTLDAPREELAARIGVVAATVNCVEVPGQGLTGNQWHTWYVVPGIEWPGSHGFGLWGDVAFEAPVLHWYLETPLPAPQIVVRAQMRLGDQISEDDESYNTGTLLAEGRTQPAHLSPFLEGHPQVEHSTVDGRDVYHFTLPLEAVAPMEVAALESFNVRIDAFVDNPVCNDPSWPEDHALAPRGLVIHGSEGHWPRLEAVVLEPLSPRYLMPARVEGMWMVDWAVDTPWGPGDAVARLVLEGPEGTLELEAPASAYIGHGHVEPPSAMVVLQDGARGKGYHTVQLVVVNHQGTAQATATAAFHSDGRTWPAPGAGVVAAEAKASPAPAAALLLALVGLLAWRRVSRET